MSEILIIVKFQIFQVIQFTLSIFSLVYLQTLLAYYSRQQARYAGEAVHHLDGTFDENTYTEPRNECNEDDDTLSNEERNIFERTEAVNSSKLMSIRNLNMRNRR